MASDKPKKPSPAFLELQEKAKNALADARRVVAPLRRRLSLKLRGCYDDLAALCQTALKARPGEISVARLNKKIDEAVEYLNFETNPGRLGVNALLSGEATFATQPSADGETIYAYLVNADGDPIRGTEDLQSGKLVAPKPLSQSEPTPTLETLDDLCAFFEIERSTDAKKPTPAFLRLREDAETALRDAVEKMRSRFGYVPKLIDAFRNPTLFTHSYVDLIFACGQILSAQPGEIQVAETRRRLERQLQKFNEEVDPVYRALQELENGRAKLGAVLDETGERWVGRVVLSNGEEVAAFRELFQAPLFEEQNVFSNAADVVAQILPTFDGKNLKVGKIPFQMDAFSEMELRKGRFGDMRDARLAILSHDDKPQEEAEARVFAFPASGFDECKAPYFWLGSPALYLVNYTTVTMAGKSVAKHYFSADRLTYLPFDFLRAAYKAQFDAYEAALAEELPT